MARRLPVVPIAIVLLLVALIAAVAAWRGHQADEGNLTGSGIGGPFTLVDQNGRTVTDRDFDGRWRLMYFGYTFCPDVCPTDAARISAALKLFRAQAPDRAARVTPMFLTVDPERDTPARLKEFLSSFDPAFVGLTGSVRQVDAARTAWRVYAARAPVKAGEAYLVDHTAAIYLMGPHGEPTAFTMGAATTPEALAQMLSTYVR